ncbi:MAG: penicillin-binding protein activator [Alphaproteobacteria bacterium]|nr:penicillin-binding protein activator [Alphaproteobacteria bacterium]
MPRPVFQISPRVVLVAAVLALAACAQSKVTTPQAETQPAPAAPAPAPVAEAPAPAPARATETDVIRIGLAVPLTGPAAAVGQDLVDAAQMAIFDFKPPKFEMRIYDTGGNPDVAASAAARARDEGVQLMLGPLLADAVAAASDVLRPAGIPVYAFSSDAQVRGNGTYVSGFVPEAQIARVVDFAARRGMVQFASLVPDDSYGNRMHIAYSDAVVDAGGQLVATEFYPLEIEGMTQSVRSLARYDERAAALKREKARLSGSGDPASKRALERLETLDTFGDAGFEAVMVPEGGTRVLQLAPLLAFYDVDPAEVKLLGTWIWDDPALGKEPSMVGAWFAAPPRDSRARFNNKFRESYGRLPNRLATLAYDGVALAAVLAQTAQPGEAPYASARLEGADGFSGVDGIFRLHANGEVERGLSVLEIRRDGAVQIDPAPAAFTSPLVN